MGLAAGDLRHRVEIQEKTEQRDAQTGAVSRSWAAISNGTVWAAIKPLSAREAISAAAPMPKLTGKIVIRYRGDVTSDMRVVHGSTIYSIEGQPIPDNDSGIEWLTLMVSTGVNQGA